MLLQRPAAYLLMNLYNLSHFLQIWAFPPGLILLLFLLGFILVAYERISGKIIILFSFALFWLFSTPIITQHLIDGLQNQYPPLAIEKNLPATPIEHSAIVILGSGVENALEYPNKHTLSDKTLSRLQYAVYLHNKIHLPIIVSGGNRDKTASTEADLMQEVLTTLYHVPVILIENKSRNTRDEALLLAPLLKARNIHTIYLITHAWHMPRSMLAFKQAFDALGITIIPAPMGFVILQSGDRLSDYLPLVTALNTSVFALHEYVGILWYRLFYRM